MAKKLYVYENAECAVSTGYHEGGGVIVITAGDPCEAWRASGDYASVTGKYGYPDDKGELGEPDHVIPVPDDTDDLVVAFPDQGCC